MRTRQARLTGLIGLGALIGAVLPAAGQDPKPPYRPPLTFVVLKDAENRFHWRLQDKDGVALAVAGQKYPGKQDVRDAVEQVRKLAASDKVRYDFRQDAKMLHRWKLVAGKDRVLAESGEGYQEKALAEKRVEAVKAGAKEADVVDKTTN
jgi:uncharacterized protein YegP (UPF0339 family)